MLIKLIPVPPHPSVLFAITFANAPFAYSSDRPNASVPEEVFSETSLVMPAGWAAQLGTLASDDLDFPTALHALDCAAGIPSLLQEVTLDVPSCTIRCSFIDGSVEEWTWPSNPQTPILPNKQPVALSGPASMQRYMNMLDSIIRDVNQSAIEEERDRQKDLYSLQQQEQEQQGSYSSNSSRPTSPKPALRTHKKQRSFFMNFVASIVNLTPSAIHLQPRPPLPPSPKSSLSPISIPLSTSPPPTPTCLRSPFPPLWSPPNYTARQSLRTLSPPPSAGRTLRWRARSTLVDAFRRFVLPEIAARSSYATYHNYHASNIGLWGIDGTGKVAAGYYVWAMESMLRRATQRMDELANTTVANGIVAERDRDRKLKSRIFPRFSVPRRKCVQEAANKSASVRHYRRSAETRAEQERDRQEAEYFATTTQSIQSPHLFSDEEDSTEDGRSIRKGSHSPSSEDGDTDTIETDTDGSSVHTPSSGHESFIFPPPTSKPSRQSKLPLLISGKHTRSASQITLPTSIQVKGTLFAEGPPPGSLSPMGMAEYKSLSRLSGKLQHLLFSARERTYQAEHEAKQREASLEFKSKRRAWLNRALRPISGVKGNQSNNVVTYGYIATCTMSRPSASSPLARWTWTSEDWDYFPDICMEEDEDDITLQERARFTVGDESEQVVMFGYQLRRTSSRRDGTARGEAMLFPVVEEDEGLFLGAEMRPEHKAEEALVGSSIGDDNELRELELGIAGLNLDVEAGEIAWTASDDMPHSEYEISPSVVVGPGIKVTSEPERPRVRVRTSSMYEQKTPFGKSQFQRPLISPTDQRALSESLPAALTTSSLLCQPLNDNDYSPVFTPPLIEKSEPPMICASFAGEIRDSDEFTLSMDLPPPKKGRSNISTFSNIPVAQSLTIYAPSPQCGRQPQLTAMPDAL